MDSTSLYVLIFAAIGISLAYLIDDIAFLAKGFGGLYGVNALAANLSASIYLFNRAFMALILPALGFLVDSGVEIRIMLIAIVGSTLLMGVLKIAMYRNIIQTMLFVNWMAKKLYGADRIPLCHSNFSDLAYKGRVEFQPALAMILFIAGMTIPSIIAIHFFDNRAFFIQLSFIFNMVGTLLTILFIERKIAIDAEKLTTRKIDKSDFIASVASIILSRVVGVFIYALIAIIVLAAIS